MPNVGGRGRGDLYVTIKVSVPKKLTKEQKHLVEELAKTLPPPVPPASAAARTGDESDRGLFDRVKDIFG
jgi:DnaJ-class molecular chaperone